MMTIQSRFLFHLSLILFITQPGSPLILAQDTSSHSQKDYYWVNIGGGYSWIPEGFGQDFEHFVPSWAGPNWNPEGFGPGLEHFVPFVGGGLYYQSGSNLFSMRVVTSNVQELISIGRPWEVAWDLGVLYGRCLRTSKVFCSLSGGIGIVGDTYFPRSVVGICLEGQLFWMMGSKVGIGITGFADLNKEKSFAGTLLCLQIGKLR